jgi:glyoxalase-like protein
VLRIDHVVRAVPDLEDAAASLVASLGLASVPGGVHPSWGTGNRIVPLGDAYIELAAVIDAPVASANPFGRAVAALAAAGGGWYALCLADERIDVTAGRLGLEMEDGARVRPDGQLLRWRSAGLSDVRRTPDLPFFISWDVDTDLLPGHVRVDHPCGDPMMSWVAIAGDGARFRGWTEAADLPVRFVDGPPKVLAVGLATSHGELVIG